MSFAFRDVSGIPLYVGNCNICGREHPDRQTALIISWWQHSPNLPATLCLCAVHAEQLAHYAVLLFTREEQDETDEGGVRR